MSDIILERCPFCGGPARLVKKGEAYKVYCRWPDCDAQYGWCATKEAAIQGWNSRVTEVIKIPIDKKGRLKHVKALINMQPTIEPSTNCSEFPNNSDTISRKATTEAIEKCHKQCCRIDSCGDEWIHYETTLNEVESIPPMPSNTSNALEALNSVNATQFNALDSISRQAAIKALDKRFDSIPMEQTKEILLLRRDLRKLPSAEPHWISCKKELPKLDSRCVLLYSDYTISGGYYRGNRTFEVDYGAEDVNTMVIAWMPRPEAWKGEVAE